MNVRRKRELGYCMVSTASNGTFLLQRDQFEPVRAAWLKGVQFVDAIEFFGNRITLKLTDVDSISDVAPEVEMAALLARRADEADDSLAGGAV